MLIRFSKKLFSTSNLVWKSCVIINSAIKRDFLSAPFPELEKFSNQIRTYEDLYKYSTENSEEFWSILAKSRLQWFKPFSQVRTGSFKDEYFRLQWFLDGKLNVSGIKTVLNTKSGIIKSLFKYF